MNMFGVWAGHLAEQVDYGPHRHGSRGCTFGRNRARSFAVHPGERAARCAGHAAHGEPRLLADGVLVGGRTFRLIGRETSLVTCPRVRRFSVGLLRWLGIPETELAPGSLQRTLVGLSPFETVRFQLVFLDLEQRPDVHCRIEKGRATAIAHLCSGTKRRPLGQRRKLANLRRRSNERALCDSCARIRAHGNDGNLEQFACFDQLASSWTPRIERFVTAHS